VVLKVGASTVPAGICDYEGNADHIRAIGGAKNENRPITRRRSNLLQCFSSKNAKQEDDDYIGTLRQISWKFSLFFSAFLRAPCSSSSSWCHNASA